MRLSASGAKLRTRGVSLADLQISAEGEGEHSATWQRPPLGQEPPDDCLPVADDENMHCAACLRAREGACSHRTWASEGRVTIVVSTPEYSVLGETVMRDIFDLCAEPQCNGKVIRGFDWAGSSTADESDSNKNRRVFDCCYSVGCSCQPHGKLVVGPVDWKKPESVRGSQWFQKYIAKVRTTVEHEAQRSGVKIIEVLTIDGGPVSQLEVREMPGIVRSTIVDLQKKGVSIGLSSEYLAQKQEGTGQETSVFIQRTTFDEFLDRFDVDWIDKEAAKHQRVLYSGIMRHAIQSDSGRSNRLVCMIVEKQDYSFEMMVHPSDRTWAERYTIPLEPHSLFADDSSTDQKLSGRAARIRQTLTKVTTELTIDESVTLRVVPPHVPFDPQKPFDAAGLFSLVLQRGSEHPVVVAGTKHDVDAWQRWINDILHSDQIGAKFRQYIKRIDDALPLFKILIGWGQVLQAVELTIYDDNPDSWTKSVAWILDTFVNFLALDFFSMAKLGCNFEWNFKAQLIGSVVELLLIIAAICALYHRRVVWLQLKRASPENKDRLKSCAVQLIFMCIFLHHPVISRETIQSQNFMCVKLSESESFLHADFQIDCSSRSYKTMEAFSIIVAVLIPVGVPLGLFAILWRERAGLLHVESRARWHYAAAVSCYKPQYFYWEAIEMSRKMILINLLYIYGTGSVQQLDVCIFTQACFLAAVTWTQPYAQSFHNLSKMVADLSQLLIFVICILLTETVTNSVNDDEGIGSGREKTMNQGRLLATLVLIIVAPIVVVQSRMLVRVFRVWQAFQTFKDVAHLDDLLGHPESSSDGDESTVQRTQGYEHQDDDEESFSNPAGVNYEYVIDDI